jgi:ABC-type Zn2+ transport system substrate-binding protein/surface adhesin
VLDFMQLFMLFRIESAVSEESHEDHAEHEHEHDHHHDHHHHHDHDHGHGKFISCWNMARLTWSHVVLANLIICNLHIGNAF